MSNTSVETSVKIPFTTARILDMLQIDFEQRNKMMWDAGENYLVNYYQDKNGPTTEMLGKKAFWSWWENEWECRESVFVETFDGREDQFTPAKLMVFYNAMNQPEILAAELSIPAVVVGNSIFYKINSI